MIVTSLNRQSEWLAKRKKERGLSGRGYVPANSGARRSPEKRALLALLAQLRQRSAKALRFTANF